MSILNDTFIFIAVIQHGGFSHAAKYLGISNGMVSRRIAHLEAELGTTLIKRTTRQFQLTDEGELFWQHAQNIKQEMDAAVNSIRSTANKPQGIIRISAPLYIGRNYITPIIIKFLNKYTDIKIDLDLSNQRHDPIKEQFDFIIRGTGFVNEQSSYVNHLRGKLLLKDTIGLYASPAYLQKQGNLKTIDDLVKHVIVSYEGAKKFTQRVKWHYSIKNKESFIECNPAFNCNDIESSLTACILGYGIGKFTKLAVKNALQKRLLVPILQHYDWGVHSLYAVYSNQQKLPQRTRLLLDFIYAQMQVLGK